MTGPRPTGWAVTCGGFCAGTISEASSKPPKRKLRRHTVRTAAWSIAQKALSDSGPVNLNEAKRIASKFAGLTAFQREAMAAEENRRLAAKFCGGPR